MIKRRGEFFEESSKGCLLNNCCMAESEATNPARQGLCSAACNIVLYWVEAIRYNYFLQVQTFINGYTRKQRAMIYLFTLSKIKGWKGMKSQLTKYSFQIAEYLTFRGCSLASKLNLSIRRNYCKHHYRFSLSGLLVRR